MIKISITIPNNLFEEAKDISGNFSALATEAIGDYIRRKKVEKQIVRVVVRGPTEKRKVPT